MLISFILRCFNNKMFFLDMQNESLIQFLIQKKRDYVFYYIFIQFPELVNSSKKKRKLHLFKRKIFFSFYSRWFL